MFELPTLTHATEEDRVCFDDIPLENGEQLCVDLDKYRTAKAKFDRQVDYLAKTFVAGEITLEVWRRAMRTALTELYSVTYLVGIGGVEQFSDQHGAILDGLVRSQYSYLDNWANELQALPEDQSPSLPSIIARALLYGVASNAFLQRAITAAMGMPILPAYSGDGSSLCRVNDKCYWRIEPLGGRNWNAYWTLRPAEHCQTCLTRAAVWSPLLIRNGVILPYANLEALFA